MKIVGTGIAGTLESSDVMITVRTNPGKGLYIKLQSTVKKQFGKQILKVAETLLKSLKVEEAAILINDRGALDCTIEARLATAVYRGARQADFDWEKI